MHAKGISFQSFIDFRDQKSIINYVYHPVYGLSSYGAQKI